MLHNHWLRPFSIVTTIFFTRFILLAPCALVVHTLSICDSFVCSLVLWATFPLLRWSPCSWNEAFFASTEKAIDIIMYVLTRYMVSCVHFSLYSLLNVLAYYYTQWLFPMQYTYAPVMNVQLCSCGGGIHMAVSVQVEVKVAEGRNPSSHWKVTVAPSLVCE